MEYIIGQNRPAAALKFGQAVHTTLDILAFQPELGVPWESKKGHLDGASFHNVMGFRNYLIFYRTTAVGLHVMRVIDGRRDLDNIL